MKKIIDNEPSDDIIIVAPKKELLNAFKEILFRVIGGAIEYKEAKRDFEEYLMEKVKK